MYPVTRIIPSLILVAGLLVSLSAQAGIDLVVTADDPGGNGAANGMDDHFRVVRSGTELEVYVGGQLSQSLQLDSLETLTVQGSADDDTLTVDFGGGSPIPSGGLVYNGAANVSAKGDTMRLEGGQVSDLGYRFFTPTDGAVDVDGRTIAYTGLEPVVDLVPAANLTVNGTNASNSITYRAGTVAGRGLISVDAFETIEFANKTQLTINGLDGDDRVVLTDAGVPTGLMDIVVNGGNGDDVVSIYEVTVPTTLNGDGGDDLFRVVPSSSNLVTADGGSEVLGDVLAIPVAAGRAVDTGTEVTVNGVPVAEYTDIELVRLVRSGWRQRLILKTRPLF
jgi:hypothetical protein